MNTMSKSLIAALALVGGLVGAGTANAQRWNGNGYGYSDTWRHPREHAAINRYLVDSTCSGRRGHMLENRLRLEVNRGQIGGWTARRIQSAINDLQYQERRECGERDFHSARDIGKDYIRIRAWIDDESGRYRGSHGGYWRR